MLFIIDDHVKSNNIPLYFLKKFSTSKKLLLFETLLNNNSNK